MFKDLKKGCYKDVEKEISDFWEKEDILKKSFDNKEDYFVFYDGPATANGFPGLHHMLAKFLKDSFCKYKSMNGYKVYRKIGWDTHGLPVELQVEKELGFSSKTDIEKYGIEEFNKACREIVWKNEASFRDLTTKMGQFIDTKNPYITYDNNYIETEWWILKKFFDEGLFYEGHKILPYCTRCGTGLASHEVAQGYKEVSVNTVYVKVKKKDSDINFLIWTTTPWTLISNVAVCVNPDEDYALIKTNDDEKFILAKALINTLFDDYVILETYKGSDLEYMEYEQIIQSLSVDKKAFYVTCDKFVSMSEGTGIVHMAPAFGNDDAIVGKRYNLPYLNPVGEEGKYKEGLWKGIYVFDADENIIKYLKENNKLFKKQKILHNYPHCWRCSTPLIYYSKPSYYLEVTKLKDKIISANNTVSWHPAYVGEKRFGNWLLSMNDWAISRSRYWGTPLPLWRCGSCSNMEMIGSVSELKEKAIEEISDSIDLHRPYIDNVHLKCCECGNVMTRVSDVIDCWFDSGSMPFAQYHYPFENVDIFDKQFPADFIAEGIDQTRGWFYTLLVISVFVKGVSPYKNVLVNDLLLDSEGKKMSKSKGNIVPPFETMEKYGADTVRFYLAYVSPVWTPLKFDYNGLKEVHSKFFNPLKNTYNFFVMYANIDRIDPSTYDIDFNDLEYIDKWILSKYNQLIKEVTIGYDEYDLNKVTKLLTTFVSENLSNWYIRRTRDRFWESGITTSKKVCNKVVYDILVGISGLLSPIAPYISEEIYKNLTNNLSVHLSSFPKCDDSFINKDIENKMDLVRTLISLGRNLREEKNIKVRQPLSEIILDSKYKDMEKNFIDLIKEELNIKNVVFSDDLTKYMDLSIKPNFKEAGKVFGSMMNEYVKYLNNLNSNDIKLLESGENFEFNGIKIDTSLIDVKISSKDSFDVATIDGEFVVLNTILNDDLIEEGFIRELTSKIQNLRKEKNFNIIDRIIVYYNSNEKVKSIINKHMETLKSEVLALLITEKSDLENIYIINNEKIELDIEAKKE